MEDDTPEKPIPPAPSEPSDEAARPPAEDPERSTLPKCESIQKWPEWMWVIVNW